MRAKGLLVGLHLRGCDVHNCMRACRSAERGSVNSTKSGWKYVKQCDGWSKQSLKVWTSPVDVVQVEVSECCRCLAGRGEARKLTT
jgi:hypothetical protein